MNKISMITLLFLLAFSVTFNAYFLTRDNDVPEVNQDNNEQDEYIKLLENEINVLRKMKPDPSSPTDKVVTKQDTLLTKELEEATKNFLNHVYNVTPENYVKLKQNARTLMSEELFNILFAAHGLDVNAIQTSSTINGIEYYEHQSKEQVFVKFNVIVKDLQTNYKEEITHTMILHFTTKNNELIVEMIEPISDMGAV